MFSDHEVAAKVLDLMKEISGDLNRSLVELEGQIPDEEWKAYRLGVGHILGEMLGQVTHPIAERYPDLRRVVYGD